MARDASKEKTERKGDGELRPESRNMMRKGRVEIVHGTDQNGFERVLGLTPRMREHLRKYPEE